MEQFQKFIDDLAKNSSIDKNIINKHFSLFLEKINPDVPVDLEYIEKEFVKTLIEIKKEHDGLQ